MNAGVLGQAQVGLGTPSPLYVIDVPVTSSELEILMDTDEGKVLHDVLDVVCGNNVAIEDNDYYELSLAKASYLITELSPKELTGISLNDGKFTIYAR